MGLALHSVVAKVRQKPEAIGGILAAHIHGDFAYPGHEIALPHLNLRHMRFGNHQQHHRGPFEFVQDDDNSVILVTDRGRRPTGDYFTEYAVGISTQR